MTEREQFEAWLSAPPYERDVQRLDDTSRYWLGQYYDYSVQLAWEAWQKRAEIAEWRPIETAPLETEIWATDGEWHAVVVLSEYSIGMDIHHWAVCQEYDWSPTHWMPLPDPPK